MGHNVSSRSAAIAASIICMCVISFLRARISTMVSALPFKPGGEIREVAAHLGFGTMEPGR